MVHPSRTARALSAISGSVLRTLPFFSETGWIFLLKNTRARDDLSWNEEAPRNTTLLQRVLSYRRVT